MRLLHPGKQCRRECVDASTAVDNATCNTLCDTNWWPSISVLRPAALSWHLLFCCTGLCFLAFALARHYLPSLYLSLLAIIASMPIHRRCNLISALVDSSLTTLVHSLQSIVQLCSSIPSTISYLLFCSIHVSIARSICSLSLSSPLSTIIVTSSRYLLNSSVHCLGIGSADL